MPRLRLLLTIGLQLSLPPVAALANHHSPAAEEDRLIDEGLALREKADDAGALKVFQRAWQQSQSPRALAQLALAEQALGRWVEAEEHLRSALAATQDPWIAQRRSALDGALDTIDRHLGHLEVIGDAPGAEILVGGRPVARMPMAGPVRVVVGTAVVEVRAPGYIPVVRPITIVPAGFARESVDLVPEPAPRDDRRALRIAGGVGFGLSAALLGGGFAAYMVREEKVAAWNDRARCLVEGMTRAANCAADRDAALLAERLEIAAFASAGAVALVSAILVAIPARRGKPAAPIAVTSGPGAVGLALRASF